MSYPQIVWGFFCNSSNMDRVNELSLKLLSITNNDRNEKKMKKRLIMNIKKKINSFFFLAPVLPLFWRKDVCQLKRSQKMYSFIQNCSYISPFFSSLLFQRNILANQQPLKTLQIFYKMTLMQQAMENIRSSITKKIWYI